MLTCAEHVRAGYEVEIGVVLAEGEIGLEALAQHDLVLVVGVLLVAERVVHVELDLELIERRVESEVELAAAVGVDEHALIARLGLLRPHLAHLLDTNRRRLANRRRVVRLLLVVEHLQHIVRATTLENVNAKFTQLDHKLH